MPSDDLTRDALAAIAGARDDFRSALVGTVDQLRGLLLARAGEPEAELSRATAELGNFAAGHIDVERFASLFKAGETLDESSRAHLERATETLESLVEAGDDLFVVRVPAGGDLRETVARALGEAGRAFGAARTAELARTGRFQADEHKRWIDHFASPQWTGREREIAPPLVVVVRGEDFRPAGLSDFLDGSQKIVVIVEGKAPPASLVRCVTPGVHVLQTDDPAALARIEDATGPAIAALVSAGAAQFENRPAGDAGRLQLRVDAMPDEEPNRPLGRISVFQQAEELHLLRLLAAGGAGPGLVADKVAATDGAPATDADVLAAWILSQGAS